MATVWVHFESSKIDPVYKQRLRWTHGCDEHKVESLIARQKEQEPGVRVIGIEGGSDE